MRRYLFVFVFIVSSFVLDAQSSVKTSAPQIYLSNSVFCTPVKDQSSSPTCWVFGTNSLFESDVEKKYGIELDLSEMFIARYAYIDKINKFLATGGKTYAEGGGQFHDVIRVVNKYGMVPEEAYSGKLVNQYNHDHSGLDSSVKKIRYKLLAEGRKALNEEDIKLINDTLDHYLGKVPEKFWYDMQQYTPKSFAKEVARFGNDYIELMSFADLPYYQKCLLNDKFNWAGDSLYNITVDDMQMLVDTALAKGWSVGWEGDVTDKGFNFYGGYASQPPIQTDYAQKRLQDFEDETTERDHMLHLVGLGFDNTGAEWYYLKNSWGTWLSKFNGYLFMDTNYFKLKTVVLMVNKEALPQALKKKLGI